MEDHQEPNMEKADADAAKILQELELQRLKLLSAQNEKKINTGRAVGLVIVLVLIFATIAALYYSAEELPAELEKRRKQQAETAPPPAVE
jgi:GTP cyclohydrolase II